MEASSDAPALPEIQSVDGEGELGTLALTDESEPLNVEFGGVALNRGEHDFQQAAEQAVRLRVAHLCRLDQRALAEAIELGGLLFGIKERPGHGNWLPFLRTVEINERTAQNYLLFHKHEQHLRAKNENHAGLTLTAALALARRLNKLEEAGPAIQLAAAEGMEANDPVDTAPDAPALGVVGAALDSVQIEARLVITRTIPPMKEYDEDNRVTFEDGFRLLAGTLHRAAAEGIAAREIRDDALFAVVEAMHKSLRKQRKEAPLVDRLWHLKRET